MDEYQKLASELLKCLADADFEVATTVLTVCLYNYVKTTTDENCSKEQLKEKWNSLFDVAHEFMKRSEEGENGNK